MSFKGIIRPTRWKIAIALLIPLAYFAFLLAFLPGYLQYFLAITPAAQALGIIFSALIGAVVYYPLACGIIFIYEKASKSSKKKAARRDIIFVAILIAVFNPLTYSLIFSAADYVNRNVINQPCGVEVIGYTSVSPARESMMVTGEIITNAEGQVVESAQDFFSILKDKKVNDTVYIATNVRAYSIKLAEDPETKRPVLGIIIRDIYCPRGQNQTQSGQQNLAPQAALEVCMNSCIHTLEAGDSASLQSGHCLLDPINVQPEWVCDIAHSPRLPEDDLPENQCSFYRSGNSTHFIELTPECVLIRAV